MVGIDDNERLQNYTRFFADQINEMVREYSKRIASPVRQLVSEGFAHYAVIHGVDESRGQLILKFGAKSMPRLNMQRSMVLIKRSARELWGEIPSEWSCSLREFLERLDAHSSLSSVLPIYKLSSTDKDHVYIGCGGVSNALYQNVKRLLGEGRTLRVMMYEAEPPTRYLANLAEYIKINSDDANLKAIPQISYDQWSPELLAYDPKNSKSIPDRLLKALECEGSIVLQGPPGTGKSFCAAHIIAEYLTNGKSVCVTAMANKALMELILQPPLAPYLRDKRLAKTLMTTDESAQAKGLQEADSDFVVAKGSALFATYYKLSEKFRSAYGQEKPLFDLIVVEEASQAYLTTLSACIRLGLRCLIVGDPMQLSPIIEHENKIEYKHWDVATQAEGLSSLVLGTPIKSFRITTTFRLTPASAALTGLFYGNTLRSVSPKMPDWSRFDQDYFPKGGGVVLEILSGGEDGVLSDSARRRIIDLSAKLSTAKKEASLAIVTPFSDSAKAIQRCFAKEEIGVDVSIETIDRVQGATVDYSIIYLPLRNVGFAFNPRRFNVATSRSRTTTLILCDYDPIAMGSVSGKVREFLMKVPRRVVPQKNDGLPAPVATSLPRTSSVMSDSLLPGMSEVQIQLEHVHEKLALWLDAHLTELYPNDVWKNAIAKNLSEMQYRNAVDNGVRSVKGLDFNGLISVFVGNFRELRSLTCIDQEMQTLAHHARDIRNAVAHHGTLENMKSDTIHYYLDTLRRFVFGLEAVRPVREAPARQPVVVKKTGGITIRIN